jgi:molybdate transport system substrate-binding protein
MSARSSTRTDRLRRAALLLAAALALGACHKSEPSAAQPLRVAAAADLSSAFRDVGAVYEQKTGQKVDFSFGATGLLEKQIAEGAPFDVFAAANVSYVDDAVKAGACVADSKSTYATGHVVLFSAKEASFHPQTVADLTDARVTKIAIANPDHAPYGAAAKQAMQHAGVWDKV